MILLEMRRYLQSTKVANLYELSQRFAISVDVARDMLAIWQRKGYVKKSQQQAGCGSRCVKCSPALLERYEWVP